MLSYPRSGNHLFRGVFEMNTKIPSVGCVGSTNDESIFAKNASIYIPKSHDPILFKAHFIREVFYRESLDKNSEWRLIFLFRDPFDAIASHITRSLKWFYTGSIKDQKLKNLLKKNTEIYLNAANFYQTSKLNKVCINFKEMVSGSKITIFDQFNLNFDDKKIKQITKNSQKSISKSTTEVKEFIENSEYANILEDKYLELLSEN